MKTKDFSQFAHPLPLYGFTWYYPCPHHIRVKQAAAPAVGFTVISEDGEENAEVVELITKRADAKKAKNFSEADAIRDQLKAMGIEVTDVPGGAKWKRV